MTKTHSKEQTETTKASDLVMETATTEKTPKQLRRAEYAIFMRSSEPRGDFNLWGAVTPPNHAG